MNRLLKLTAIVLLGTVAMTAAAQRAKTYTNPIIHADYSDPDVCRVGNDFYMTASSFNCFPGLQILHSTDLVHWEFIAAALNTYPFDNTKVEHGNGMWAPAIRYHNGEFYIYCGDPDRGVFMIKSEKIEGPWSEPVWVWEGKGYIDPCPFWDEDGKAYLSHGCAGSRAGVKSVLFVAPMSEDGTRLTGLSRIVYDGHKTQPTIEGTKFYKRNGYYYIFSPAGGVPTGWQVVLRAKNPFGPYEERVVMAQGTTNINGPHQGAWIETEQGEDWFIHFQDKNAYGLILHLQPMTWVEDWPVIGEDKDGDGVGEPVTRYPMPNLPSCDTFKPATSDEFTSNEIGLQWQWQAMPSAYWSYADATEGLLKLYSVEQPEDFHNLMDCKNLLLQKFPAADFTVTAKVAFIPNPQLEEKGEACGLIIAGQEYSALKLVNTEEGIVLQKVLCVDALEGTSESVEASLALESVALPTPYSDRYMSTTVPPVAPLAYERAEVYLRVKVKATPHKGDVDDAVCTFSYSLDGRKFIPIGEKFTAVQGKWIGAKFGFFCTRTAPKNDSGWMEIDWIRVE